MTSARFTPFELLLLQSRDQADTAALLLLAWVLTHRGTVGEAERAHLVALTGAFRHGHDLAPLLEIAASQDLSAIQLAAEVLQKELHGEAARAFLRLAITLATDGGEPTLANHHVLRFLADLLGVTPEEFAALYASQTGRPLATPADPSRGDYWRGREGRGHDHGEEATSRRAQDQQARNEAEAAHRRRAEQAEARRQAREAREEAKRRRETERQEEKIHRRAERQAAREQTRSRREAARRRRQAEREARRREKEQARAARRRRRQAEQEHKRGRREDTQRDQERRSRQERAHSRRAAEPAPPDARVRSALAVLGLEAGASRGEIRKAYRRLAQAHHPDRFHQEGDAIVASASRRFQRIRRAYDFLMKVS